MNEEEFIGILQACYFGNREAFNTIVIVFKELKEENNRLKAELELHKVTLKREHEAIHKVNDLEDRIEKAIEYIEKHINSILNEFDYISTSPKTLLKILKGVSK